MPESPVSKVAVFIKRDSDTGGDLWSFAIKYQNGLWETACAGRGDGVGRDDRVVMMKVELTKKPFFRHFFFLI